jgi:hypothetical protein
MTNTTQPFAAAVQSSRPRRRTEHTADRDDTNAGENASTATGPGTAHQTAKTASDDRSNRDSYQDRCGRCRQQARPTGQLASRGTTSPGQQSRHLPPVRRARNNQSPSPQRNVPSAITVTRRLATTYQPARRRRIRSRHPEPPRPFKSTSSQLQQPSSRPSNGCCFTRSPNSTTITHQDETAARCRIDARPTRHSARQPRRFSRASRRVQPGVRHCLDDSCDIDSSKRLETSAVGM